MQSPQPLLEWSEPMREFVGFIAQFLALGAVGFRFAALRNVPPWHKVAEARGAESGIADMMTEAARRAARLGLAGFAVQAVMYFMSLPNAAARVHTTVAELIGTVQVGGACAMFVLGIVGLTFAAFNGRGGWRLALVGVVLAPLNYLFVGQWSRLVNPVHRVVAGLWIGTLFVMVVAGIAAVMRDPRTKAHRGPLVADLVNGFSPLALTCGMLVVVSGLTTAWRHLTPLSTLWTTPYGYALMVKLFFVAIVFSLGAWNWRRQRPKLGSEETAADIQRSSRAEITAAVLVLMATAVVVSLPAPRPPGPPPGAPAAPTAAGAPPS